MKGSLHSRIFLHELGHHEGGLRTARRMSHVYVLDAPQAPRVLLVSDGAVNIAPDLNTRCDIVQNSIDLARMLGIGQPRVALLSAVEVINPTCLPRSMPRSSARWPSAARLPVAWWMARWRWITRSARGRAVQGRCLPRGGTGRHTGGA